MSMEEDNYSHETESNYAQIGNPHEIATSPIHWEPAPQWAKDAKEKDREELQ